MRAKLERFIMLFIATMLSAMGVNAADEDLSLKYNGNYYEISSYEDMLLLSQYSITHTCEGMVFKVVSDEITFPDDSEYQSIGSYSLHFSGTFDGQGVVFKGVTVELFGHIEECKLSNITLDESCIIKRDYKGDSAGLIYESINCTISNCTFKGIVLTGANTVQQKSAGLIRFNKGGLVQNCINYGKINVPGSAGLIYTNDGGVIRDCANYGSARNAGIVRDNTGGQIVNCLNYGEIGVDWVSSDEYGGIVANCLSLLEFGEEQALISNCINYGRILGNGAGSGGIASVSNAIIEGCINYGTLDSRKGSFGGIAENNMEGGIIRDCSNHGELIGGDGGGIVNNNRALIRDCVNDANILTNYSGCGGIVSYNLEGIIVSCYNSGDIIAEQTTSDLNGGIAAKNNGTITSCVNTGSVSGRYHIGGLVGYQTGGACMGCLVRDCNISGDWSSGAVFGEYINGKISENYYLENVMVKTLVDNKEKEYSSKVKRGVGTLYGCKDITEKKVDGVVYYNGAVLKEYETGGAESWNNLFMLVYLVDDGIYKVLFLNAGDEIIPEEAPTKDGFVFSGWSDIPEVMPTRNVMVTGNFIATGIRPILPASESGRQIYAIDGKHIKKMRHGLNILREKDGRSVKLFVK